MGQRLKFRRRKDPKLEYKPCWFSIFLCRDEADGKSPVTYVKSLVSTNYQIGMQVPESMLKPGKHILKIEALWGKAAKQYQSFCLKLQAKQEIKISDEKINDSTKFVIDAVASRALQGRPTVKKETYKNLGTAAKYSESNDKELFYSWIAVFNND